jgi:hypothetical protein
LLDIAASAVSYSLSAVDRTLGLLTHLGKVVRLLETVQERRKLFDRLVNGSAEGIDRLEIGIRVALNADDDAVVEGMRTLNSHSQQTRSEVSGICTL